MSIRVECIISATWIQMSPHIDHTHFNAVTLQCLTQSGAVGSGYWKLNSKLNSSDFDILTCNVLPLLFYFWG